MISIIFVLFSDFRAWYLIPIAPYQIAACQIRNSKINVTRRVIRREGMGEGLAGTD